MNLIGIAKTSTEIQIFENLNAQIKKESKKMPQMNSWPLKRHRCRRHRQKIRPVR
ncbi:hypothetical protein KIN20_018769 [Parelaphostrongylus tenuis]|uniref:Uncharacterized protein n=1 Tax=Parelaphostrongylus tenuis TaxID=148309 RepID=A0AAD5MJX2_PARTN|nr:hypothetical protein KIN20_018769 [Parelaphostrongylus tenuis]